MFKKILLLSGALALSAMPALAESHGGGKPMGPPPGLLIPLPPGFGMPPPPKPGDKSPSPEGMATIFKTAIDSLDSDGDGLLSKGELKVAHEAVHKMMGDGGATPPVGPPPFPHLIIPVAGVDPENSRAAFDAVDSDEDDKLSLEEIKAAFDSFGPMDGGDDGEMGMDPEWPEADCNGATGNEITRDLTGAAGDNAVAVSLLEGREASCFSIATDATIEAQVIEETDPPSDPTPVMWHSDDGEEALDDLVLEQGIYHIEIISADDESVAITVTFVDYPAE